MASSKGKYQTAYENRYGKKDEEETVSTKLQDKQEQINKLSARLAASGVDPSEGSDTRNWLEKALNLTPNQNVLRDIQEVLGRPQQAIFGAIDAAQNREDALSAAIQGIKGDKDTSFKDILMNTGQFDDTTLKETSQQTDSKIKAMADAIDLVDVLGLAGDIFLDPMDIPFIPVSTASKATKAIDTASDVTKALDTAKVVDTATDVAKTLDTADDAIKLISLNQGVGKLAKGAVKGGAKLADTGLEKVLTKIDDVKGIKYTNPTSKWATELGRLGNTQGLLETYKGLKNNVTTMFNTKLSKLARGSKKVNDANEALVNAYLDKSYQDITDMMQDATGKLNKTVEQIDSDLGRIVDQVATNTMEDVIKGAKNGAIKGTDEIVAKLKDIAADVPDSADALMKGIKVNQNGFLELSEDWDKLIDKFAPEKMQDVIQRVSLLSEAEQKEIADLIKEYNEKDPELVQAVIDFYNNGNNIIGEKFGVMKGLGDKFNEGNLEGYSKHRINDNYEKNLRRLVDEYGVDPKDIEEFMLSNTNGYGATGSKTLNSRKYNMSAKEANLVRKNQLLTLPNLSEGAKKLITDDIDLFDTTATAGMRAYMTQMPRLAKYSNTMDEIFIKQGIPDLKEISSLKSKIKAGEDIEQNTEKLNKLLDNSPFRVVQGGKASHGFVRFEGTPKDTVVNLMISVGKKSGNSELVEQANKLKEITDLAIDPTVLNLINVSANTTQKSEFSKLYTKMMNFFKGNATASVTNQVNNLTGNMTNMYLSGMSAKDIAEYSTKAQKYISDYENIIKKGVTDIASLTDEELEVYNAIKGFQENVNLLDSASMLAKYGTEDLVKGGKKGPYGKYVEFFSELNAKEDRLFKFATYLKAKDDPKFLRNLGIDTVDDLGRALSKEQQAGMAVGKVLFDPTDLTAFEQNTMKNIIPFYNYAKKNLAFQISSMGDNLQRYNRLMKGYDSLTRGYGEDYDNMKDYIKDNMYIPIPSIDKDGNYTFIKAQLPMADLIDFTNDPLSALINKSNPFAKGLFEAATNVDTFTGADIESKEGEKADDLSILEKISNDLGLGDKLLPTKKQQKLIENLTGLGTQTRQLEKAFSAFDTGNPLDALTNQVTVTGNVDKDKLDRTYDEVQRLKDLMLSLIHI